MGSPISALASRTKYSIDFALVPVAIILIEFAVFTTQVSNYPSSNLGNLILLRLSHTVLMVLISLLVSQAYIGLKKSELNYRTLCLTGVFVIALGDLTHVYLSSVFGIELIDFNRRIGVILFEGAVWFPAFLIIAGNRKLIVARFKEYEKRLIIATRATTRTSDAYIDVQKEFQNQIRKDLQFLCSELKSSITKLAQSSGGVLQLNKMIAPYLLGEDLRNLSMSLQNQQVSIRTQGVLRKKINSLSIFYQQFGILYSSAIRRSPLSQAAYVIVLLGLVTPLYMYFYSFTEALTELPILFIALIALTALITKMQRNGSSLMLKMASVLIFTVGLLPMLLDLFGEPFGNKIGNHFPLIITAYALPVTFYISMELFQVLRPTALALIQSDELQASPVLQSRVSRTVGDEFSRNLSHQWAVFIHGKILTRLDATSLKLEVASNSADEKSFHESIHSLLELLDVPDRDFEGESTNLLSEVNSRLDPWKGLLTINLDIDPELKALRNPRIRDLGEVIEELISNSIRHGKAQNIELRLVGAGESEVQIISIDDAVVPPPQAQGRSGLGTLIFNLASDGRWSIIRNGAATEFRLTMAI